MGAGDKTCWGATGSELPFYLGGVIITLIIKITIPSIEIGLKNSYFPLHSLAKLLSDS